MSRRFLHLLGVDAALVAAGALVAAIWVYLSGGAQLLAEMAQASVGGLAGLAALTASWGAVRFVRWQFLLRRAGVRLPERASLSIYLASLLGIMTPAYVGELIRAAFIRQQFGVPLEVTAPLIIFERLLDIAALSVILLATAPDLGWRVAAPALAGVMGVLALTGVALQDRIGNQTRRRMWLWRAKVLAQGFGLTLLAWTIAGMLIPLAAASVQIQIEPLAGIALFSRATLWGGLTLLPAGMGVTGSIAILQLQGLGLAVRDAVVIASLYRGMSTGLTLAVGTAFLLRRLAFQSRGAKLAEAHFDRIAGEYSAQFSPHVWNHLLERKVDFIIRALPESAAQAGLGLDLGCGLGVQCAEMNLRGYRVVGLDVALDLLRQGHTDCAPRVAGEALQLPFADESFDFVYTIGVLHHLRDQKMQATVCREVARILRPNGVFVVHESNPRNPLFRFYLGYLFPLLHSIDEGTEWWIDPGCWERMPGLGLVDLRYFTFLPDFLPDFLFRPALAVQRFLERGAVNNYAAHYVAVLRRAEDPRGRERIGAAPALRQGMCEQAFRSFVRP